MKNLLPHATAPEGIFLLEKDTGCAGAGCGFCTKPARRRFCRFCLLLSLISRPPPFSACRTAFPARRPQEASIRPIHSAISLLSPVWGLPVPAAGMASVCTYSQTAQPRSLETCFGCGRLLCYRPIIESMVAHFSFLAAAAFLPVLGFILLPVAVSVLIVQALEWFRSAHSRRPCSHALWNQPRFR